MNDSNLIIREFGRINFIQIMNKNIALCTMSLQSLYIKFVILIWDLIEIVTKL